MTYDALDEYEAYREATFSELAIDDPNSPGSTCPQPSSRGTDGKADRAPLTISQMIASIPARLRATLTRRETIELAMELAR